jgi:hypothetical protein
MARQSPAQRDTVERVMHAFKEGELETSRGTPVRSRRQAVAIALHEAGASNQESPAENRRSLARTKRRERAAAGGTTRAALYAEARRQGIRGRSKMTKAALEKALHP